MAVSRAGKRPFFMSEQFRLRQAFGQRAAVDGDERLSATQAVMMQITGDNFFTRAGFTDDQHGGIGRCQPIQYALKSQRSRVNQ